MDLVTDLLGLAVVACLVAMFSYLAYLDGYKKGRKRGYTRGYIAGRESIEPVRSPMGSGPNREWSTTPTLRAMQNLGELDDSEGSI